MKQLHVKQTLELDLDSPDNYRRISYTVKKIVNSTVPEIDSKLDPVGLNEYCESDDWNVTVT